MASLLKPDTYWLLVWVPALVSYMTLLHARLNARPTIGSVEVLSKALEEAVPHGAQLEVLAEGFLWTEGPLWMAGEDGGDGMLIFSDTKRNAIYQWEQGAGAFTIGTSLFLNQSGCRADEALCSSLIEPGARRVGMFRHGALVSVCS
jgi:gluconolactonase